MGIFFSYFDLIYLKGKLIFFHKIISHFEVLLPLLYYHYQIAITSLLQLLSTIISVLLVFKGYINCQVILRFNVCTFEIET